MIHVIINPSDASAIRFLKPKNVQLISQWLSGTFGISTAYHLAKRGYQDVTCIDKHSCSLLVPGKRFNLFDLGWQIQAQTALAMTLTKSSEQSMMSHPMLRWVGLLANFKINADQMQLWKPLKHGDSPCGTGLFTRQVVTTSTGIGKTADNAKAGL